MFPPSMPEETMSPVIGKFKVEDHILIFFTLLSDVPNASSERAVT